TFRSARMKTRRPWTRPWAHRSEKRMKFMAIDARRREAGADFSGAAQGPARADSKPRGASRREAHAGRQRIPAQEIGRRQALAAGALQRGHTQHAAAAGDTHAIRICRQNRAISLIQYG